MEYLLEKTAQKSLARFGKLQTPQGIVEMPALSPGIRTNTDALALLKNTTSGIYPQTITPFASYRNSYLSTIGVLLGRSISVLEGFGVKTNPILVIPDIESEALSFNCIARGNYTKFSKMPEAMNSLFKTGLKNCHSVWKNVEDNYTTTPIKDWALATQRAVGSDAFFAPTPIIRAANTTVEQAFRVGYSILDEAKGEVEFPMYGLHLLLHSELFRDCKESNEARAAIFKEIDTWSSAKADRLSNMFLSLKIHDNNDELTDSKIGSSHRQTLSEFITELSERVRKAKGALVTHNFGIWGLGMLDSGADVSSFRISGRMRIDVPVSSTRKRTKYEPAIYDIRTLAPINSKNAKKLFEKDEALPIHPHLQTEQFWNFKNQTTQKIYEDSTYCAALIECGEKYRRAGLDKEILLKDALRSQILDTADKQALLDLCPSLW